MNKAGHFKVKIMGHTNLLGGTNEEGRRKMGGEGIGSEEATKTPPNVSPMILFFILSSNYLYHSPASALFPTSSLQSHGWIYSFSSSSLPSGWENEEKEGEQKREKKE